MSWRVAKEDENGNELGKISSEFKLTNINILFTGHFRLLKYLDPYGDTIFNTLMMDDLIADLLELKTKLLVDNNQIEELIDLAKDCKRNPHTYLIFYGD
jgi:hypothetical protein